MLSIIFRNILSFSDQDQNSHETSLLVRLEAVQFLASMAVSATGLYVVVLGKELGLSDVEIGTLVTGYSLSLLVSTYVFGTLSDVYGRRLFLITGFLFSSFMLLIHALVFNYASLLFARLVTGVALGVYPAALFSLAATAKARMGRFSAYGALGGFVGLMVAGVLTSAYGTRVLFIFGSVAVLAALVLAIPLKGGGQVAPRSPLNPRRTLRENLPIYAALLVRHSAANLAWTFWPLYLLVLGADYFYVGFASASNALAQFLGMFFLADRFAGKKEFDIGLVLSALTFVGLGLATNLTVTWLLFTFTGVVWAFLYVGGIRTVVDQSSQKGAAIAAFNSVVNMSTVLGPMMATMVIAFADYRATMYVAAAFAFASCIISRKMKPNGAGLERLEPV
jgi:MFS family permease